MSWTYNDLLTSIEECSTKLAGLKPSICLIESDYTLKGVAWLIAGLCFDWRMVPVVSKNEGIINARIKISEATHRVSEASDWQLRSITTPCDVSGQDNMDADSGVILFSSGSTGEPKAMCKSFDIDLTRSDVNKAKSVNMGLLLLFDHIGGLNTLISGLKKTAHLVAPTERNPRTMAALIEKHSVRVLPCSPTFLNMMYLDGIFEDFDFRSLRLVTYGTERMPEELLGRLSKFLPRTKFLQTFGTSETGIVKTKSLSSSSTFLTIDDPLIDWKVVDDELWLRTKTQILGYMNVDEQAIEDGWFKTGDLIEMRDDAYFKVIGRKNEVINVGGEKVLPAEIEDLLMTLDQVIDCTAFSVPNGLTGQSVGVRVVPVGGADLKALKKEIRLISRIHLESFKVPAKIVFESDLKFTDRFKKMR
jgi:acyl-coenzyme A synthetase/AMP-(fatty) acid ligase